MGLDFYGLYARKDEDPKDLWDLPYAEQEERELFYGRKSWELVYALKCDTREKCYSELKLNDWVDLMEIISPIAPYLDEIASAYRARDNIDGPLNAREVKLIRTYEKWYNESFDYGEPQLGYGFSVGYMKNFWEAGDRVIKYLEDPEYTVYMFASY